MRWGVGWGTAVSRNHPRHRHHLPDPQQPRRIAARPAAAAACDRTKQLAVIRANMFEGSPYLLHGL